MKIAVTGASGVLGRELIKRGCLSIGCDILEVNDLRGSINAMNPDVIIHCAALTNVEYCEKHFDEAFEVNVRGTANVVESLPKDAAMIYISTDHVFSGQNFFSEGYGEWHTPSPVNNYGFTKWGGEIALQLGICKTLVVRTSRCYDYEWMKPTIEALKRDEEVVFTNLIKRSFMYLPHLVDSLMWICNNLMKVEDIDILNVSGESVFSYSAFWQMLHYHFHFPGKIIPRQEKIEDFPRPFRAGLNVSAAKRLGVPIGNISSALVDLKEIMKNE